MLMVMLNVVMLMVMCFCFFSVRLLSVLRCHSFFSSPPQRPMTSDFEGFSIPDFIHYIYFPIFILEKEPVFPFLMFNHKQGSNVDGGVDGSNVGGDVDCSNVDGDLDGSNVDGGVDGLSNVPFTGNIQSNTSTYPISRTMFLILHEKDPRVYRRQPARPPTTCVLYDFKKTTLNHKSYFTSRSTYCYIMVCKNMYNCTLYKFFSQLLFSGTLISLDKVE